MMQIIPRFVFRVTVHDGPITGYHSGETVTQES
jgi:hypothetical protein